MTVSADGDGAHPACDGGHARAARDGAGGCAAHRPESYIESSDSHIAGAGAVGVWTKADSVTAFDDFTFQASP
jgi:hypothetical protein